jgi:hypothetical protein
LAFGAAKPYNLDLWASLSLWTRILWWIEGNDAAEAAQHETGALRSQDLKRVAVDFTTQPRAISFPTELLHAAINGSFV